MAKENNLLEAQKRLTKIDKEIKEKRERLYKMSDGPLARDLEKEVQRDEREKANLKAYINNRTNKKARTDKVNEKYMQLEKEYGSMDSEKLKAKIDSLEKEINGKTESLDKMQEGEAKEKLAKQIAKLKKEKEYLEGYSKNRNKIEKIKYYKTGLLNKINSLKTKKKALESEKDTVQKKLEKLKQMRTEDMTNTEYNDLIELSDKVKKLDIQIKEVNKKIPALERAVSKCDLAWKTLFANKDWDEIQRRAMDGRYVRNQETAQREENTVEGQIVNEQEVQQRQTSSGNVEQILNQQREILGNNVEQILNQQGTQQRETSSANEEQSVDQQEEIEETALTVQGKTSLWARLKNFVKDKFSKSRLNNKQMAAEEANERATAETTNQKRDAFLEELRGMVEGKEEKEKAYIEKHKIVTRENTAEIEENERDEH